MLKRKPLPCKESLDLYFDHHGELRGSLVGFRPCYRGRGKRVVGGGKDITMESSKIFFLGALRGISE